MDVEGTAATADLHDASKSSSALLGRHVDNRLVAITGTSQESGREIAAHSPTSAPPWALMLEE